MENVFLPQLDSLTWDGQDALEVAWSHDFGPEADAFLSTYIDAEVKSLKDVVQFNKAHSDLELPPRTFLSRIFCLIC